MVPATTCAVSGTDARSQSSPFAGAASQTTDVHSRVASVTVRTVARSADESCVIQSEKAFANKTNITLFSLPLN